MNHRLHTLKPLPAARLASALIFLFLVGALFAALALFPVMAQTPGRPQLGPTAPAPGPASGEASMLIPSFTGYIVDNSASVLYFRTSATPDWQPWSPGGVNNNFLYALANDNGDWAEWHPDIPTGWYEVFVHYVAATNRRTDAEYTVYYDNPTPAVHLVNQQLLADGTPAPPGGADSGWVRLGVYHMLHAISYVRLTDVTTPAGLPPAGYVIADAVKFAPADVWVDDTYTEWGGNDGRSWGVNAFATLQEGLLAVASGGTVTVKPGTYTGPITITQGITLTSTGGAASTIITISVASGADTAVQVLADGVTVRGFTVQSNGAPRGIANYRVSVPTWEVGVDSYRILNNVVQGFQQGMTFYQASGEISGNTVHSTTQTGIWIRDYFASAPGSTTVARNVLYGNGTGGGIDFDILVQDSYTGTAVVSNTITGSGAAGESCIYVVDRAGDLMLQDNTISGCWNGVRTEIATGPFDVQLIRFSRNVISAGRTGISITYTGGGAFRPIVVIGGSLADSNRIFGNSEHEVWLMNYGGTTITATHNYWGVCNLRGIEDEIRHQYDSGGLSLVTYEPALCVPTNITVQVRPDHLPADGFSTAVVTATATDIAGTPVVTGTMIGISAIYGSVPFGFAEAESGLSTTGPWPAPAPDIHASGGGYVYNSNPAATMSWTFKGTAVSLMYARSTPGGLADVYVDGALRKTISMQSIGLIPEWQIEDVIANDLSATGTHTVEVRLNPASPPGFFMWLDAFRSGGTVLSGGCITTTLTSAVNALTDTITAAIYNGRVIDSSMAPGPFTAVITDSAEAVYLGADVSIAKSVTPAITSPGKIVTYTIAYSNTNVITATGTIITDTLPSDFVYVSSKSTPTLPAPIQAHPLYVWTVGNLKPGGKGWITVTARVDESVPWPSTEQLRTNVVEISTAVTDTFAAGNSDGADVTVRPNPAANISLTAYPTAILADNMATSVITAEVTDTYYHPVLDGTVVTFTTSLAETRFQSSGSATGYGTTTDGIASITLEAGTIAGMTWITATANGVSRGIQVELYAEDPAQVFISANPMAIPVSNGEISSTLRITVTDQYGNLVRSVPVTLTTDAGWVGANGVAGSELVVMTTNGLALAKLGSAPVVMTATVTAAITAPASIPAVVQVAFVAAEPVTITSAFSPPHIRVCNGPEGTAYLTVTVIDKFGNPVPDGTPVMFSVRHGDRGEAHPSSTGTVAGMAYSTVLSKGYKFPTGQREGTLWVDISAGRAGQQATYPQPITLTPGLADNIAFTITPSPVKVQEVTHIEARVMDCAGNAVDDGTLVAFGATSALGTVMPASTNTNNGLALATFQAGCTALPATLTATVDSLVFTTTIPIDPGVADMISMDITPSAILNCGGTAVVTATLRDACTNLVKDGTQVLFAQQYGFVSLSRYVALTYHGIATATVTADQNKRIEPADWPSGFEQINAKSGTAMPGWANLTILPGLARRIFVSAFPGEIPINGDVNGYNIAVSAIVADCSDTPVIDLTPVRLETSKGVFLESGQWFVDRWTSGGLVDATLTSQSVAGDVFITATSNSGIGTAEVYFQPGDPWFIDVWSTPREWMYADGQSQLQIWARVTDEYHNPVVEGVTVAFVTDYGHFVNSGDTYTTTTMTDGLATATLVADVEPHTALVRAITENYRHGYTYVHMLLAPEVRHIYMSMIMKRKYLP